MISVQCSKQTLVNPHCWQRTKTLKICQFTWGPIGSRFGWTSRWCFSGVLTNQPVPSKELKVVVGHQVAYTWINVEFHRVTCAQLNIPHNFMFLTWYNKPANASQLSRHPSNTKRQIHLPVFPYCDGLVNRFFTKQLNLKPWHILHCRGCSWIYYCFEFLELFSATRIVLCKSAAQIWFRTYKQSPYMIVIRPLFSDASSLYIELRSIQCISLYAKHVLSIQQ